MTTQLLDVLEVARWAPSGDNTQNWRFSIGASDRIVVHGFDTRAHCVYDLDGRASQISLGALLETIALAATRFGLVARTTRRDESSDERPIFDIAVHSERGLAADPLATCIEERRVQRGPLRVRPLTAAEKMALERAVAPGFGVLWLDGWSGRASAAWLNFRNAKIRLTLPEAYRVHKDVIDWDVRFSQDRIPAAALGASGATLRLMRWAMTSWKRLEFLNRYLGGTIGPRLELDLLPGLACGAHAALVAERAPASIDDYVGAGRALQRFWLTATSLGLQFQPGYTPLVFARYARDSVKFTENVGAVRKAQSIRAALDRLLGVDVALRTMFIGRIGAGSPARSRSLRLPLERLLQPLDDARGEPSRTNLGSP